MSEPSASKAASTDRLKTIRQALRRLFGLYVENVKLSVAEKLTIFLSASLLVIIGLVLGVFALAFFSGALLEVFVMIVPVAVAYVIVGAFYLVLVGVIIAMRATLIVNPIARFVSRLVLQEDDTEDFPERHRSKKDSSAS